MMPALVARGLLSVNDNRTGRETKIRCDRLFEEIPSLMILLGFRTYPQQARMTAQCFHSRS